MIGIHIMISMNMISISIIGISILAHVLSLAGAPHTEPAANPDAQAHWKLYPRLGV